MKKDSKFDFSTAYDEMFMDDEGRAENQLKKIYELPLSEIDDFPDHPYRVVDDEDMLQLSKSISAIGMITPVTVHQKEDGRYEMISGHRRKYACEKIGLETIRAEVIEVTRDEAIILMVDSNAQRSEICPCDKGRAYKMKLEAMKRMPGRPCKENGVPEEHHLEGKSREILAEASEDSNTQIQRFIRLTYLTPELQEYVDSFQMKMRPAVELSYCTEETQRNVVDRILETDIFPSHDQAIRIRRADEQGYANYGFIQDIMSEEKPNQKLKFKFSYERLSPLLPDGLTASEQEDFVVKALEVYRRLLKKQRENSR